MKRILLFLLVPMLSFAQNTGIEMLLVNPDVGTPSSYWGARTSNDSGLNAILQSHAVTVYTLKLGNPYYEYDTKTVQIQCADCNLNALKADLEAYSSVVTKATLASPAYFINNLSVMLRNAAAGTFTGTVMNIATTNDSGLNQIFQNFNVRSYDIYGDLNHYKLRCDCDNTLLKAALDNYDTIVLTTDFFNAAYLLSNQDFTNPNPKIYPNPFSSSFQIETNAVVSNYSLYDISGKLLISTDSKAKLDNHSSLISSGAYLLKLTFDNQENYIQKLIKI